MYVAKYVQACNQKLLLVGSFVESVHGLKINSGEAEGFIWCVHVHA